MHPKLLPFLLSVTPAFSLSLSPPDYLSVCLAWSERCGAAIKYQVYPGANDFQDCLLGVNGFCMLNARAPGGGPLFQDSSCVEELATLPPSCVFRVYQYACQQTGIVSHSDSKNSSQISIRYSNGQSSHWHYLQQAPASLTLDSASCVEVGSFEVVGSFDARQHVDAIALRHPFTDGWCFESIALLSRLEPCPGSSPRDCATPDSLWTSLVWRMDRMQKSCSPCGKGLPVQNGRTCYWLDDFETCYLSEVVLLVQKDLEDTPDGRGGHATDVEPPCSFLLGGQESVTQSLVRHPHFVNLPRGETLLRAFLCSRDSDCFERANSRFLQCSTHASSHPYGRCRGLSSFSEPCGEETDNACRSGLNCVPQDGKHVCLPSTESTR